VSGGSVLTEDPVSHLPATITPGSFLTFPLINPNATNGIDTRGMPVQRGIWTLRYDDASPGRNLTVSLTISNASSFNSSMSPAGWSRKVVSAGVEDGTALRGITHQYALQFASGFDIDNPPTKYNPFITMTVTPGGGSGNCQIQNPYLFAPPCGI